MNSDPPPKKVFKKNQKPTNKEKQVTERKKGGRKIAALSKRRYQPHLLNYSNLFNGFVFTKPALSLMETLRRIKRRDMGTSQRGTTAARSTEG